MARIVVFQLFLFALPFLLYATYVFISRRSTSPDGFWSGTPVSWLAGSGLLLTIAGFILMAQLSGSEPGGVYEPARLENGKIIPGRTVRPAESGNE